MTNRTIALCIALLGQAVATASELAIVQPTLETRAHFDDAAGGTADVDDPAIWVNPKDPKASLVVSTLKERGIDVYDLDGKLVQHIPPAQPPACTAQQTDCAGNRPGRINNADLIYGFPVAGTSADLVVVSDRGLDKIAIYRLQPSQAGPVLLQDVTAEPSAYIFSNDQDEVNTTRTAYGLAVAKTDVPRVFVSQNGTARVAVLDLIEGNDGQVAYRANAMLQFPSSFKLENGSEWTPCNSDSDAPHFEGMVADLANNRLYLAQEAVGVWHIALDDPQDQSQWRLFARVRDFGAPYTRTWDEAEQEYRCDAVAGASSGVGEPYLYPDVEGLTLYESNETEGYLLVSSQGNNTVVVYEREAPNTYLGSFRVDDGAVDGVNETDGMMVTPANLGGSFSEGLLVMQDGKNMPVVYDEHGAPRESSNFKFVAWGDIAAALGLDTTSGAAAAAGTGTTDTHR